MHPVGSSGIAIRAKPVGAVVLMCVNIDAKAAIVGVSRHLSVNWVLLGFIKTLRIHVCHGGMPTSQLRMLCKVFPTFLEACKTRVSAFVEDDGQGGLVAYTACLLLEDFNDEASKALSTDLHILALVRSEGLTCLAIVWANFLC